MNSFPEETFMRIQDEPAPSSPAFMSKEDKLILSPSANVETEGELSDFKNKEYELISSASANTGIKDELTPNASAFMNENDEPISSTSANMEIEDELTPNASAFVNTEDEPIPSASAFMNKEDELISSTPTNMRKDDPIPSASAFINTEDELISSSPTNMRIDDPTPNASAFISTEDRPTSSTSTNMEMEEDFSSSTSTNMRAEDEPTSIPSYSSFNAVQRNRKRKQRREELSFKPYILRVKKSKFPNLRLSSDALEDLNNIIIDVYQLYCSELKQLTTHTKKRTLSIREIEAATKLCIPGKRKGNAMKHGRDCVSFQEMDFKQKPMQQS